MKLLTKYPLIVGTLIPLILFTFLYSVNTSTDLKPFSDISRDNQAEINKQAKHGTKMPRDSFVQFQQNFVNSITREETTLGLGSGVVIKNTKKGSYILTNNHVCSIDASSIIHFAKQGMLGSLKNVVQSLDGEKADVLILKKDNKTDQCLVFAEDFYVPAVKISNKAPKIGEDIYVVGAPRGYYAPKYSTVPILRGIFSGYDTHWDGNGTMMSVLSIRIAPGSSGSPIFNRKGELVGIVHSHMVRFDEISWGTTYYDTKDFIRTYMDVK